MDIKIENECTEVNITHCIKFKVDFGKLANLREVELAEAGASLSKALEMMNFYSKTLFPNVKEILNRELSFWYYHVEFHYEDEQSGKKDLPGIAAILDFALQKNSQAPQKLNGSTLNKDNALSLLNAIMIKNTMEHVLVDMPIKSLKIKL